MDKVKCYIYGIGSEYQKLSSYLYAFRNELEILGVVTSNKQSFSSMDGFKCFTPDKLTEQAFDYVIIAVQNWQEIKEILLRQEIREEKMIRSNIFYYPFFDLDKYIHLKENPVSILSNFCLGGAIYKSLGLEAITPTKNMFCLGKDFIEFLQNYEYYLSMDMNIKTSYTGEHIPNTLDRERFIPKGMIDSKVVWYFNHNIDAESAVEKWNRKRKKVNLENVAAIMTIFSDEEAYAFEKLEIDKKIGVYYKDLALKNVVYCQDWENREIRKQYDYNWAMYANRYMLKRINWIHFLLGRNDYIRY